MDETIVRKLDDVEYAHDRKYDATHTDVILEFEGERVSLDLGDANYSTLRDAVKTYLAAGTPAKKRGGGGQAASTGTPSRRGGNRNKGGAKASTPKSGTDAQKTAFNDAVRTWARSQNPPLKVSDQGRISNEVLAEYKNEHPDWEREFFMDSADDTAANAPQAAPVQQPVQDEPLEQAAPVDPAARVDEHGWSTETPTEYSGVGSYH